MRILTVLVTLALIGTASPLRAAQVAPSYYYINGHRLTTIGPTVKALTVAYEVYARGSVIPPWRLLAGRVVDVVRHDDRS